MSQIIDPALIDPALLALSHQGTAPYGAEENSCATALNQGRRLLLSNGLAVSRSSVSETLPLGPQVASATGPIRSKRIRKNGKKKHLSSCGMKDAS